MELDHESLAKGYTYVGDTDDSELCDGDKEDNAFDSDDEDDERFFGQAPRTELKLIDRSFTNLGYIGFGDGIDLDALDTTGNWQFDNVK